MKQVTWLRGILCALVGVAFAAPGAAQTSQPTACGWNPDSNGDYVVTVTDLLALLSVFEEADADMDGIFDSMDDCVGIYDACGICSGSGVDADADGICDDVDPCVGALDACGVCNGPGPSIPVIDEIVFVTDSIYVPPIQQWYVFSYAVDTLYTYVCPVQGCTDANAANFNPLAVIEDGSCSYGPAQCGGASTVTFDGHTYALVGIGNQCWFKENLRSDNYSNGDAVPGDLTNNQWTSTGSGAQAVYNNDPANLATYGRLYNWYAVNDARGVCPVGFHVPSDSEWTVLENALGGSSVAGTALKSSAADSPPLGRVKFQRLLGLARWLQKLQRWLLRRQSRWLRRLVEFHSVRIVRLVPRLVLWRFQCLPRLPFRTIRLFRPLCPGWGCGLPRSR